MKKALGLSLLLCFALNARAIDLSPYKWGEKSDPKAFDMKNEYTYDFYKLPLKGNFERMPWSENDWRVYKGAFNYRWNQFNPIGRTDHSYKWEEKRNLNLASLSPFEKLEIYINDPEMRDYLSIRERNLRLGFSRYAKPKHNKYNGYSHAWAPASSFFKEPNPVIMRNDVEIDVPFGSSDIKALLMFYVAKSTKGKEKEPLIGINPSKFYKLNDAYKEGNIDWTEFLLRYKDLGGIDAGAFHVILSNRLGLISQKIGQKFANERVGLSICLPLESYSMSYPIYSFESKIMNLYTEENLKVKRVETTIQYVDIKKSSWKKDSRSHLRSQTYIYKIFLDENDKIIGGEWADTTIPAILWRESIVPFENYHGEDNATSKIFGAIEKIYKESIR